MLLVALTLAALSLANSAATMAIRAAIYDDSPAMRAPAPFLISTELGPGEPLRYRLGPYTKRADCAPPAGRAELAYRVWAFRPGELASWSWLDYARESRAKAGRDVRLPNDSIVPLPVLAPGDYALQWRGVYTCANASEPQTIDGPLLKFRIVG